ncbi:indole-3-glycerol phosphate synthase TrpC [Ferrimicrobium acidiphilum]|uniref:indole-3-glycerol phosphate synthase TrpC n=1 Tax=Ferrimicrobium acidiphilum TaxID=121039 RepID=UPI0023F06FA7|nr:indole-3-glycerol phosphate synthase TrpC [Ferrimicrobium acidiphilum]
MATYLDAILDLHRERCANDRRDLAPLREECERMIAAPSFEGALRTRRFGVIAEVKRRSPVRGSMTDGEISPREVALDYQVGGAAAISVLTDAPHFGGSLDDLAEVAQAVSIPVLRKDFLLSERDLCDARIYGASAALLIAAALDRGDLERLIRFSGSIGIDILLEVHDPEEISGLDLVGLDFHGALGINQRDLLTFEVDPDRAVSFRSQLGDAFPVVAESGVKGPEDARALAEAGYDAILVGETLMRAEDRLGALKALCVL